MDNQNQPWQEWENWMYEVRRNGALYTIIALELYRGGRSGLVCLTTTNHSNRHSGYNHNTLLRGDDVHRPFWYQFRMTWYVGLQRVLQIGDKKGTDLGTVEEYVAREYPGGVTAFSARYGRINYKDMTMYGKLNNFIADELKAKRWDYFTSGYSYQAWYAIDVFQRIERNIRDEYGRIDSPKQDQRYIANHTDPDRIRLSPDLWYRCNDITRLYIQDSVSAWDTKEYEPTVVVARAVQYLESMRNELRLDHPAIRIYMDVLTRQRRENQWNLAITRHKL